MIIKHITIIAIMVISMFVLETAYKCIDLSIFLSKHCKSCHEKDWLLQYLLIIVVYSKNNTMLLTVEESMWPDLRKSTFHTHNIKTHFSPSNNSCTHWRTTQTGIGGLRLLWFVSEAYQASTSAQVVFKWLHLTLINRQPAVIHYTTGWWVWLWI